VDGPRLTVLITAKQHPRYAATVVESAVPLPDPTGEFEIDAACPPLQPLVDSLADAVTGHELLEELGDLLFRSLFAGNLGRAWALNWQKAVDQRCETVRLLLRIPASLTELWAIPWQYMFDRETRHWLGASPGRPRCLMSYHIDATHRDVIPVQPPLRILVVCATPSDLPPVRAAQEVRAIRSALTPLTATGAAAIAVLENATWQGLEARLSLSSPAGGASQTRPLGPHVVHFIGHGQVIGNTPCLALERNDGMAEFIPAAQLEFVLRASEALRLVILNACESERVALAVAQGGIATVGARFRIEDATAVQFAGPFYRALAQGEPVDSAANAGRVALWTATGAETRDWGLPVVLAPGGQLDLFRILPVRPVNKSATPPQPRPTEPRSPILTWVVGLLVAGLLIAGAIGFRLLSVAP
jgi:hypothetical protein